MELWPDRLIEHSNIDKYRQVGEAYFKRAAVYNSFNDNLELLNPEFLTARDLFVYENRNLIVPNENGLFDFNQFSQEVNLKAVDLAPFYREVSKQKNKKFLDWIKDHM